MKTTVGNDSKIKRKPIWNSTSSINPVAHLGDLKEAIKILPTKSQFPIHYLALEKKKKSK
jgi:Ni,Fe-hydrogenase maturation factor